MATFLQFPIKLITTLVFVSSLTFSCQATHSSSLTECLTLQNVLNFTLNQSLEPNSSSDFDSLLRFSLQNLRVVGDRIPKPTAIILPENKEHLIHAVGCCRRSLLDITIRCGGHSYEGLSSFPPHDNPFVIIDMMNLNRVIVDVESETAWVEGGATLGELYTAIAEHSSYYGFPAGVGPTVGVSGHFSGGGISVMSRKYGLSADNVLDVVLIDANGRDLGWAEMGEDVFWALRGGGGGNWGVVYRWKVQLVKVPERVTCFSVTKQGSNHELAQLVYKWQFIAPYLDDSFYLAVSLTSDSENQVFVTFIGFYVGPKIEAMSQIGHFPELIIRNEEYLEMSWIESVLYFSGLPKGSTIHDLKSRYWTSKSYVKTKSDYVKKPISIEGLEGALNMMALEPTGLIILEPYGGIMDRISSDSIPFPHRKGNLYDILYASFWMEEEDEERHLSWIRRFYEYMTPFVSSNPRAAYVNYVDLDLGALDSVVSMSDVRSFGNGVEMARAWGEKYFLSNYDRLVRAKNIIDPHNIFSHPQGIPPSNLHAHDEL